MAFGGLSLALAVLTLGRYLLYLVTLVCVALCVLSLYLSFVLESLFSCEPCKEWKRS